MGGERYGNYQVSDEIGRGGMAVVYRGHHTQTREEVAIKMLPFREAHTQSDLERTERFRREAETIARLGRHRNVLDVLAFGEQKKHTYLVMPLIRTGSLADRLGRPMPTALVCRLAAQIASALDFAHAFGIIHRDIKPSNILISEAGDALLADFGLAKIMDRPGNLTTYGMVLGSPEYMAPEQVTSGILDERADLYSFALVVYEMLAGAGPFEGESTMQLMWSHVQKAPPPLRTRNATLSPAVEEVIQRALAKDPNARYPRAGAFVSALKNALAE